MSFHDDLRSSSDGISRSDFRGYDPVCEALFASSKAFCRCRLFQLRVREMLSTQSSFFLSNGSTVGKGKREAEMVT